MFDEVPVRVWLMIAIGLTAYSPLRYLYEHIIHAPSRREITQPSVDLSWRTSGRLARNLSVLAALLGIAIFMFTPMAEQFARSPRFWPILVACLGVWALFTVVQSSVTGNIEPFVRGIYETYDRTAQPKRFWASLTWNAALGCLCLWIGYQMNEDAAAEIVEERCFDEKMIHSPQDERSACNELIADYSKAIRLDPRDPEPRLGRGTVYHHLGKSERAIEDYSEAIRLNPDDADAYFNRGLLLLDTGKFAEAVADFTRLHRLKPDDHWPVANRGIAYAWMNDVEEATADFNAVRTVDPSNPVLKRGEALLAMNSGDLDAAVDHLTASLNRDPNNLWALSMRAKVYRQLGEHGKARADTEKLQRLSSGMALASD